MEEHGVRLGRRDFFVESAVALGSIVLCSCSLARSRRAETEGQIIDDYYTSQQKELLKGFDDLRKHTRGILITSYGEEFANTIDREAQKEFELLIPEIPYIGGDANDLTQEMIQSAMALALYRAMKGNGKTVEDTGSVLYRTVEAMVGSYPRFLTRAVGFYEMSRFGQQKRRRAALESQKRLYPQNWVFSFVEGDGTDFDWGIDYTECGIVKFFHAQAADEMTPYLCLADFPMSEAFGMGLVRNTTIAEGAEKCDFRFKRGRETQQGWPPEFLNSASA